MSDAKDIRVQVVTSRVARSFIERHHYSGKVVNNSQVHFGVFLGPRMEGCLQYGPPMIRRKMLQLVEGTTWYGMLELNRMAFTDALPRNSESRALGITLRWLRKHLSQIDWVLSFADATQCGDGTIYRAAGFVLTQIKRNESIIRLADGSIGASITYGKAQRACQQGGRSGLPAGSEKLPGFQLRYMYFLDPTARDRLTVPVLPFSAIQEAGASMYKGVRSDAMAAPTAQRR